MATRIDGRGLSGWGSGTTDTPNTTVKTRLVTELATNLAAIAKVSSGKGYGASVAKDTAFYQEVLRQAAEQLDSTQKQALTDFVNGAYQSIHQE